MTASCPTDSQLAALLAGSLPHEECAAVDRHLDSCSGCRSKLNQLAGTDEPTHTMEAAGLDPRLRDLIEGLKAEPPLPDQSGEHGRIGRYKLLQRIGEGGMGEVWMAEQFEPVRRRVALKIIKAGMDTREVVARFEAERQALAIMDHPNIAKVLDGGAAENGRPYFVMELVRGARITEYCDEHRLPTLARLKLFLPVCQAIQHAHQKGIVHRDIKPSNILVTLIDGEAVPKVIDFGIARAMQQQLTDKTLFTQFEQFVGTPAYMSPEQAALSGVDIDTRTDVYSLGILLYELITGRPPFDPKVLRQAGLDEIRRIIREEDPPKPSTRLSTIDDHERTTLTRAHHADPDRIGKLVRGDLDWIVMKTIEKDRARRYQTADALARDIRRFLADEPVEAAAPSVAYRVRKSVRRHRKLIAGSAAAGLILVVATAVSLWQAAEAREARRLSEIARQKAEAVLQETNETLVADLRSAGKLPLLAGVAETAARYFEDLPAVLRSPATERLRAASIENLAAVLFAKSEVVASNDRWAAAIALRKEILARDRSDRRSARDLAEAFISRAEVMGKLARYRESLELVTEAQRLLLAGGRIEELPSADLESLSRARHGTALAFAGQNAPEQEMNALEQFAAAARILTTRKDVTVRARVLYPQALMERGDVLVARENSREEGARLFTEAAEALESLNRETPGDAGIRKNLALAYGRRGDALAGAKSWREALKAYQQSAATLKWLTALDPTNNSWRRELSIALNKCGDTLGQLGKLDGAVAAFDEALELRRQLAVIDPENADAQYDLTSSLFRAGEVAFATGNPSRAATLFGEARGIAAAHRGGAEDEERWYKRELGCFYRQALALVRRRGQGDLTTAVQLAEKGLESAKKWEAEPGHRPDDRYSPAEFQKLIGAARAATPARPAAEAATPETPHNPPPPPTAVPRNE